MKTSTEHQVNEYRGKIWNANKVKHEGEMNVKQVKLNMM